MTLTDTQYRIRTAILHKNDIDCPHLDRKSTIKTDTKRDGLACQDDVLGRTPRGKKRERSIRRRAFRRDPHGQGKFMGILMCNTAKKDALDGKQSENDDEIRLPPEARETKAKKKQRKKEKKKKKKELMTPIGSNTPAPRQIKRAQEKDRGPSGRFLALGAQDVFRRPLEQPVKELEKTRLPRNQGMTEEIAVVNRLLYAGPYILHRGTRAGRRLWCPGSDACPFPEQSLFSFYLLFSFRFGNLRFPHLPSSASTKVRRLVRDFVIIPT